MNNYFTFTFLFNTATLACLLNRLLNKYKYSLNFFGHFFTLLKLFADYSISFFMTFFQLTLLIYVLPIFYLNSYTSLQSFLQTIFTSWKVAKVKFSHLR